MTHLADLPNELLCEIIRHLIHSKDICALSRANHHLYLLATEQLNSNLYHIFKSKNKIYREHHAFRWVVQEGKDLCVRRFLKAGPEILHRGFEEHPILFAARQGHNKVVQAFLEYGIDPNLPRGFRGWRNREAFGNPLTVAAERGHVSGQTLGWT
ncbi:ankyrin [Penicillium herquei]|nr:ankyrin [Penicillium herquei]